MAVILVSPAGTQEKDLKNCFWWSLILGPFYFAYMGLWFTAFISFILAVISGGISVLIYPFFTEKIIVANFKRQGWRIKDSSTVGKIEGVASGLFKCESCGMPMGLHDVSKLDMLYCVHCQDQRTGDKKPYQQVRNDSIIALMQSMGKTKEEAEKMTDEIMPKLARWRVKKEEK